MILRDTYTDVSHKAISLANLISGEFGSGRLQINVFQILLIHDDNTPKIIHVFNVITLFFHRANLKISILKTHFCV